MKRLMRHSVQLCLHFALLAAVSGLASASEGPTRSTSLKFGDEVVEGMNKNPLDSLQMLGRKGPKSGPRLYRKKTDVSRELKKTVTEMGYSQ